MKAIHILVVCGNLAGICFGQSSTGAAAPSSGGNSLYLSYGGSVRSASQGSFSGSVSGAERVPGVLALTLEDAINRGLRYNLALVEGGEDVRARRAERLRALAGLLPTLNIR